MHGDTGRAFPTFEFCSHHLIIGWERRKLVTCFIVPIVPNLPNLFETYLSLRFIGSVGA